MSYHGEARADCHVVGEYIDEADMPADGTYHRGESVRTHVVADFVDVWECHGGTREFTVLLTDGRVVAVRGHGLKREPNGQEGQDVYSVVVHSGNEEVVVAIFKSQDVSGIFCGELRSDRKIA